MATIREAKISLKQCCRTNLQPLLIMLGVCVGILVGVSLHMSGVRLTNAQLTFLEFPGELFLQMMKMIMIPVVVSSLLTATADIDVRTSGKIGIRALVYYLLTLIIASCLGIVLCVTVQPGKTATSTGGVTGPSSAPGSPLYAFMDLLRNMIPDNLIEACFSSKSLSITTVQDKGTVEHTYRGNNTTTEGTHLYSVKNESAPNTDTQFEVKTVPGVNMVGLVAVSVITGCVISYAGKLTKPVYDLFVAIRTIAFIMVRIFLWYAPVGIAFLIMSNLAGLENLGESLQNLLVFSMTVIGGLIFHTIIILPVLYVIFTRKNPYRFLRNMIAAMLLGFGSASSGITLPVTIQCLEEKNGIDPRVSRLVASVGATINMDGIAFYFSMMAIFLAQLSGITLDAGQIVNVSILAISSSVGVASVAGAQYAFILIIPAALHLPSDNVSMLLAIDWLFTRFRTVTNIIGDSYGAAIVEALSKRELENLEQIPDQTNKDTNAEESTERTTFFSENDRIE